jgi:hypothetical protein
MALSHSICSKIQTKDNYLSCIRYVCQYCFPKNRIVLPRVHRLFPGNVSHTATVSVTATQVFPSCHTILFLLIFNKILGCKIPDRPIVVSCHLLSTWFLVSLLLPLLFLLCSNSDRLQVLDLSISTKLHIVKQPVPVLTGEVTHRILGTGHRLEPDMLPVSHFWLCFLTSVTIVQHIVYCRIKKLSTDNSSETLSQSPVNLDSGQTVVMNINRYVQLT